MNENDLVVGIADIKVGKAPQIIKTNLGSCIAVCLYCAEKQVGGMLHLMLSSSRETANKADIKIAKYADTGIPALIKEIKKTFSVEPTQLVAKLFGGAKVLKTVERNIGEENAAASRELLRQEGIRVVAAQTGGDKGYKVAMDLATGKVKCQIFGSEEKEY